MNCVLISAENKVVGRAAEILSGKRRNICYGSDYMSLRNNKACRVVLERDGAYEADSW